MSLKTVQISLMLFGNFFFKTSQAHLAQAHPELSDTLRSAFRATNERGRRSYAAGEHPKWRSGWGVGVRALKFEVLKVSKFQSFKA